MPPTPRTKHVVYLLGAGFSAPLGVPVMGTFLNKARDLADGDEESRALLTETLATIDRLHVAAAYYSTDVFNIEEVLSVLEMQGRLQSRAQLASFKRFIKHVITAYTPPIVTVESPQTWPALLLAERPWDTYCTFVACLHGYAFHHEGRVSSNGPSFDSYKVSIKSARTVRYSVVSLNYDLVLETASAFLSKRHSIDISFARQQGMPGTPLAKLHGSIDSDTLVPPTWQKTLDDTDVRSSWVLAYDILKSANELRILGFSLPESDAYVKYLLRAAVIDTPNLQRIDVLCQDNGRVRERYGEFVKLSRKNFYKEDDILGYLSRVAGFHPQWPEEIDPDYLERVHQDYFGS